MKVKVVVLDSYDSFGTNRKIHEFEYITDFNSVNGIQVGRKYELDSGLRNDIRYYEIKDFYMNIDNTLVTLIVIKSDYPSYRVEYLGRNT